MTFLENLLKGVDVEWKTLGDVVTIKTGQSVSKEIISINPGIYPVINSGRDPLGFLNDWNTDDDPIGVTTRGAGVGSITWQEGKYFRGNLNYSVTIMNKEELLVRYLFHLLNFKQPEIHSLCTFDGIPALNAGSLKNLPLPIPPLEIQQKIVVILDAFTALTAELTTELTARKKQYEIYRNNFLNFEYKKIEWKKLKDITTLITKGTTPKNYSKSGIAFIKTEAFEGTEININKISFIDEETHLKDLKRSILEHNDILIAIAGSIGKCAIVPLEILPANTNQALAIIRLQKGVNLNYVFHLIKSNYLKKYIEINVKGSAQPNLNLEQLNNFSIPYPSIEEQERIVSTLDKFDTLTTSISEGLPKEIELRKKQYEYYRDMLLSFPK